MLRRTLTKSTAMRILRSAAPLPIARDAKLSMCELMVPLPFQRNNALGISRFTDNRVEETENLGTLDTKLQTYIPEPPHLTMV